MKRTKNDEDFKYQKVTTILGIKKIRRRNEHQIANDLRAELYEPNRTIFGVEGTEGEIL